MKDKQHSQKFSKRDYYKLLKSAIRYVNSNINQIDGDLTDHYDLIEEAIDNVMIKFHYPIDYKSVLEFLGLYQLIKDRDYGNKFFNIEYPGISNIQAAITETIKSILNNDLCIKFEKEMDMEFKKNYGHRISELYDEDDKDIRTLEKAKIKCNE
jgi:hypothetical protein